MHSVDRINKDAIVTSFHKPYVTAILGPRRVGKTYFASQYAAKQVEVAWVFLNMDKMDQRERVQRGELDQLISESARVVLGAGKKLWVLIDEAQKCPAVFDQIKVLYDRFKDQEAIKFILTGSAVLSLHQLSAESLAGRIELFHLNPFTLREATAYYDSSIPMDSVFDVLAEPLKLEATIARIAPFRPLLEEQLQKQFIWGGFPELLGMNNNEDKISYLKNYLQTYLEKDVRSIESIADINLYRNLMDILAEQTGSVRSDQRITDALGCSRDTLKKYRGYLEATLLFQELYPYIGTSLKRFVKSPKGYLLNNGLISLLTGIMDIPVLEKSGLIGHRLENWFFNEVNVFAARQVLPTKLYYWRTSSGVEVDFVLVTKPQVYPFEVTYTHKIQPKKIKNLKMFVNSTIGAEWAYYVYTGPFDVDETNKIIFLPCWAIA